MKTFIVLSVLALLFVIGSALAINAIGRHASTDMYGRKKQQGKEKNKGYDSNTTEL